ncbi:hypothetical protein ACFW1M_36080 [Streptomyces inhibens]|uniref:hypothetical protein n=1 Tax=Streptomyces inhibens TaxID=2293571 RepID=UPI0036B09284
MGSPGWGHWSGGGRLDDEVLVVKAEQAGTASQPLAYTDRLYHRASSSRGGGHRTAGAAATTTPADLDVVSFGEAAVADEDCGYADEGEEVLC